MPDRFFYRIMVIVGILLIALASMESRQNEYVYTLMKSFWGASGSAGADIYCGEHIPDRILLELYGPS